MAYLYPWGNTQQLNLDWILQKIKDLEAGASAAVLDEISNALLAASYSAQAYEQFDIVFRDGKLYLANADIPAPGEAWTPAHWDEILLGGPVSALLKHVTNMSSDYVINDSQVTGDTVSDALDTLKDAIDGISLDSDSVSNESQVTGDSVSDALDTLNTEIANVTPLDTVPTIASTKGITSNAVAEALNPAFQFGTITKLVATGTLDLTTCYKKGNVVYVSGRIHSMTSNDGDMRNYFEIPDGFKPTQQTRILGYMHIATPNSIWYPTLLTVAQTGIVSVGYGSGVTVDQVAFAGTYVI